MDPIILNERHVEDDYYYTLGCDDSSSIDQILTEYKHRVLRCHPDKNQDDKSTAQFQKLQEAKEVLCDPEKRKNYDRWKTSGLAISYKQWIAIKEQSAAVFHWAIPKHEKKMLESSSSKLKIIKLKQSQHSPKIGSEYCTYNSILEKFRNYEI
ncbi:J domain-containing protein [Daphnia magna]|uniref:J domain-containing protein n=1 Tax=Daphnia magna TaxID=35525 RepID=A0A0P5W3C3_9CRUS|nr:J domain-containing protein [Daphnia magna]XP_032778033.1 J domain-containing protein [Daphnia magna]KZS15714.1 J domain-containing protein [Daphnia magna]